MEASATVQEASTPSEPPLGAVSMNDVTGKSPLAQCKQEHVDQSCISVLVPQQICDQESLKVKQESCQSPIEVVPVVNTAQHPAATNQSNGSQKAGVKAQEIQHDKPEMNRLEGEAVVYVNEHQCSHVMKILRAQVEQKDFCDVVVTVGFEKFDAHRCVLAANSSFLADMLRGTRPDVLDGKHHITVPSTKSSAFKAILDYMYTGHLSVSLPTAEAMISLGEQLHISDTKQCCGMHLEKHTDMSNWYPVFQLALKFSLNQVMQAVKKCLLDNLFVISQEEDILRLDVDNLRKLVFERETYQETDENWQLCTLQLILQWLGHDQDLRSSSFPELLSLVEPGKIKPDRFQEVLQKVSEKFPNVVMHPSIDSFAREVNELHEKRMELEVRREKDEENRRRQEEMERMTREEKIRTAVAAVATAMTSGEYLEQEHNTDMNESEDLPLQSEQKSPSAVKREPEDEDDMPSDDGVASDATEPYVEKDLNKAGCVLSGRGRRRRKAYLPTKLLSPDLPVKRKRGRPRKHPEAVQPSQKKNSSLSTQTTKEPLFHEVKVQWKQEKDEHDDLNKESRAVFWTEKTVKPQKRGRGRPRKIKSKKKKVPTATLR